MSTTEQFTLSFDGEALDAGLMDVRELAPALLAAGELLQEANRVLNDGRTHVSVQVRSDFRRGSFHIDLVLAQSILGQAQDFLHLHPEIKSAKEILETVFFYVGIPGSCCFGLFRMLTWLRGRELANDSVVFKNNGNVEIRLGDTIEVANNVYVLARNPSVRRAAEAMVSPLRHDGIDQVGVEYGSLANSIGKGDVEYFAAGDLGDEILLDNTRDAVLGIVRLSFNPEHKWSFTDGTTKISARIEDPVFWHNVSAGRIAFSKDDHIRVRLRTKTVRADTGDLKSEYTVVEVVQHLPRRRPPEQMHMSTSTQ